MSTSKVIAFFVASLFIALPVRADIVSLETAFVAGDTDVVGHLNRDRIALENGVNNVQGIYTGSVQSAGQIKASTIGQENMADDANPRVRTNEGASCPDFVYSGLLPTTTTGTLVGTIPAGVVYPDGYRVSKTSGTSKTFTASKWTYVDINTAGSFVYSEQSIGGAVPAVAPNAARLCRVSTDGTQIASVVDLRLTSCAAGPFSAIKDAQGEASLGDIFSRGSGGISQGLQIVTYDSATVKVLPGAIYINGKYRGISADLKIPSNVVANGADNTSGSDAAGSATASTLYYVYGAADLSGDPNMTGVLSKSYANPSGFTNYRRIGEVSTDVAASFASCDPVSISYVGKIRQVKKYETGDVFTGATTIPGDDDTIPQITEGIEVLTPIVFTPVCSTDVIKIEAQMSLSSSNAHFQTIALFRNSEANALASSLSYIPTNDFVIRQSLVHYMRAGEVNPITFHLRTGNNAGSTTVNGQSGSRKQGGACKSAITITEYEA